MSSDYELNVEQKQSEPSRLALIFAGVKNLFFKIPRKWRIVLCIVTGAAFLIFLLIALQPTAEKRAIPETVVSVDVVEMQTSTYPIVVNANGTVEAETRGSLVAQIRGEIVAVSDNFKTGGTFKKGDVLIQIDQRDYRAELSRAVANLSQAQASYQQEQANAKQARLDWERLGNTEPAPDLVLRKPQLTAAKAQYDSALAARQTAQLNLSRTTLTAPYDGRVIQRQAVLGQYVGVGTPVAEVFATEGVEVRLPISQEEFSQLGLDSFSAQDDKQDNRFEVVISTETGAQTHHWEAKITRTDSTFDINTRQIDVIAEVADPFSKSADKPPLKIGQFVTARIQGRDVENVFVIPNKSIREGRYIYVVRDDVLTKQSINILWQDDQNALIAEGVQNGELVVVTSLNSTLAGAKAKLTGNHLSEEKPSIATETDSSTPTSTDSDAVPSEAATPAQSSTEESKAGNTAPVDGRAQTAGPNALNVDSLQTATPKSAAEASE